MRELIWSYTVRICPMVIYHVTHLIYQYIGIIWPAILHPEVTHSFVLMIAQRLEERSNLKHDCRFL